MKHGSSRAALALYAGLVGGTLALPSGAQTPLPLGPQASANSVTAGNQDQTAVAMDAVGNYVVVWRDEFLDGSGSAIVGRRFFADPAVPPSNQFVINVTTAGDQSHPAIAMNANGRFVVVWEGPDSTGPATTGIFGILRAPNGSPLSTEFQVNTTLVGTQGRPAVAMQTDGRFLITWQDDSGIDFGATGRDIAGRFYPSTYPSNPPGSPVRLNVAVVAGDQEEPAAVAITSSGGWQVGWQGPTQPPIASAIWIRALDNAGAGQPEFPVNLTFGSSFHSHLALSANFFGDSVAVWQDQFSNSILARQLDAGVPGGSEFQINLSFDNLNREPSVALDKFGNFVTIWVEAIGGLSDSAAPEGSPIVIQGRKRNGSGGFSELFRLPPPTDSVFPVNDTGSDFARPRIVGKSHGSFVAVWQGTSPADPSGQGIAFRGFLDAPFADDFETSNTSRWSATFPP